MRRLVLGAVTLGALSVGSLGAPVDASGGFREVAVTFTSTGPPSPPLAGTCDPKSGNCVVALTTTAQLSGGLRGTLVNESAVATTGGSPNTYKATAIGLFTGTVQGCGTGTFALYFPLTAGNVATSYTGHDVIVPGSGTADLTSSTGYFTYDLTNGPETTSTGSGVVVCRAD